MQTIWVHFMVLTLCIYTANKNGRLFLDYVVVVWISDLLRLGQQNWITYVHEAHIKNCKKKTLGS